MGFHKALPGIGWISLVPSGANPTPIHLATVSSGSFSVKEQNADVRDNDGYVIDSFATQTDVSGKLSLQDFSNSLIAAVARGVTVSVGQVIGASHSATIPASPYAVTVTQSAQFAENMGVMDLTAGKELKVVAATPATGEYSVAAGVYTFAAADTGHSVLIMYRYTASTSGTTAEVAKATTGSASPKYAIHVYQPRISSKEWGFYIPAARIPSLDVAFKREGWSETSIEWTAMLSDSNKLIYTYGPH